ncbi:MAG: hypothetical protein ABR548_01460 [Actinomycetota bacterium]|nr:hypothetical protein [Actinomycetota bacterium]
MTNELQTTTAKGRQQQFVIAAILILAAAIVAAGVIIAVTLNKNADRDRKARQDEECRQWQMSQPPSVTSPGFASWVTAQPPDCQYPGL